MSPRRAALASGPPGILRLRRRRDGSVALVNARGQVAADDLVFPSEHPFLFRQLFERQDIMRRDGDTIVVTLANASAVYRIGRPLSPEQDLTAEQGVIGVLEATELRPAPAVDEAKALALAETVAAARAAQAAQAAEVR